MLVAERRLTVPPYPFRGNELESCVVYTPLWDEKERLSPFPSLDPYHHTCTVTGAIWGQTGRTCNGNNDNIKVAYNSAMDTASGTILFWFNSATGSNLNHLNDFIFCRNNNNTNYLVITLAPDWASVTDGTLAVQRTTGGVGYYVESNATAFTINTWYHGAVIWGASGMKMWVDAVLQTDTDANTGSWTHNSEDLYIGNLWWTGAIANLGFNGIIGEVWEENKVFTQAEVTRHRELTKWRYS